MKQSKYYVYAWSENSVSPYVFRGSRREAMEYAELLARRAGRKIEYDPNYAHDAGAYYADEKFVAMVGRESAPITI